jgi:hypothetical protein
VSANVRCVGGGTWWTTGPLRIRHDSCADVAESQVRAGLITPQNLTIAEPCPRCGGTVALIEVAKAGGAS